MKFVKWCYLLNKRLYRKPVFWAILLLIPLLTIGYTTFSKADTGVTTVALAQKDPADPLGNQIIHDLMESSQLIRFILCDTPEQAQELVAYGKAESAWIFDDDLQNRICAFVKKPSTKNAFIQIVEREESVLLLLTREKLSGLVFTYISPEIYLQYIRENVPELDSTAKEALLEHYNAVSIDGKLFSYATRGETVRSQNYLLSPVRGLLGIVTMLCGMAAAMFYTQDRKQGLFSRVPIKHLPATEFLSQIIAVGNVAVVATIALWLSGVAGNILQELSLLVLYIPCVSLFSMILRRIFPSMQALGVVIPLLIVVALCACPVFLDLVPLRTLGLLLPPNYFIRGIYHGTYIGYMICHCIICAGSCYLLDKALPNR